ncbi:hypothetical protein M0805_005116 [Coniferiporia weirii]|nr:hypothetical protein M0805_005116 [Coniferiporia weirii]
MSAVAVAPAPLRAGDSAGAVPGLADDTKARVLITEDNFDLTVDVDSEIEDSLGSFFWDSDSANTGFGIPDSPMLDIDYDDPEEVKSYYGMGTVVLCAHISGFQLTPLIEARSWWSEGDLYDMRDYLKSRGMEEWLKEYVIFRRIPLEKLLFAFGVILSKERRNLDDLSLLPLLKAALVRNMRRRGGTYTMPYNLGGIVTTIRRSNRIMVLTGAGISVSCGIPDFRSRNGLYAQLFCSGVYDLDDPQQMFDINYFKSNPAGIVFPIYFSVCFNCEPHSCFAFVVFYSFAHKIYPSNFTPSPCHRFIKAMQDRGKNYTQNIDTLETKAGIRNVLQCHGSFATASCINCRSRVSGNSIKDDLLAQRIPLCTFCNVINHDIVKPKKIRKKKKKKRNDGWESEEPEEPAPPLPSGIMKPDITFFGEKLSNEFDKKIFEDIKTVDLLLVIGTSLKVRPVSEILSHIPHTVPVIVINKTPLTHVNADNQLLGDADVIIEYLADKLGWDISPTALGVPAPTDPAPTRRSHIKRKRKRTERRILGHSGVILFDGAEGGRYVADLLAKKMPCEWDWTTDSEDADSESEKPVKKQTAKRAKAGQ